MAKLKEPEKIVKKSVLFKRAVFTICGAAKRVFLVTQDAIHTENSEPLKMISKPHIRHLVETLDILHTLTVEDCSNSTWIKYSSVKISSKNREQ